MTHATAPAAPARSDRDLVAAMRGGESAAFEVLFRRHAPMVHAYISSKLIDSDSIDDTFQEAFVTAWTKLDERLMSGPSAVPWLLSTAHHLVSSANRRSQRHSTVPLPDAGVSPVDEVLQAEERQAALTRTLIGALERLSAEDRRVVHLCLENGLSYKEAARASGASLSVVRNRLFRARKALRQALAAIMADQQ